MGNRIRIIWVLSLASAILLIGVQGYWLYNQYQRVVNAYAQELSEKILKAGEEELAIRKANTKTSFTYVINKNMEYGSDSLGGDSSKTKFSFVVHGMESNESTDDSTKLKTKQKIKNATFLGKYSDTIESSFQSDEISASKYPEVILDLPELTFDPNKELTSFHLFMNPNLSDDIMHKGINQAITNFNSPFNPELFDSIIIADIPEINYTMKPLNPQDSIELSSWHLSGNLFAPHIQLFYLYSPFEYKGVEIIAIIPTPPLFERMAIQFLLSLALILLLAGCLILQIRTILKQKKINEMREDFVNVMIHELKRPVQTLKTFISFLGSKDMRSDELITEQVIQDSMFELDNLSAYLKKLKDMIHADNDETSLQISRFNLQELIEKVVRLVSSPAEKEVKISESYEMESAWIEADIVHVANVVNNLIENAIKYSAQHVDIEIKAVLKETELRLTVSDNGIGIPYSEQEKVFVKFYRGSNFIDKNIPGIGLGLSYVKLIAEAHKGRVTLLSDIEKGTSVTLCLPQ